MDRKQWIKWLPWILTAVTIFFFGIWLLGNGSSTPEETQAAEEGAAYLEALEAKDPAQIVETLRRRKAEREAAMEQAEREAMIRELVEEVESGERDIWAEFQDYVILGDSRAVGFYYFDFLEKSRVLAGGGDTIRNVEMNMDAILELKPSVIFLCYGLNDVSIGYWDTEEEYVTEFMQVLEDLQQKLPDTKLVVSSILPARDPAFELSSKWYNIPDFSKAVGTACAERGIAFADNDSICAEYADLWQDDGIHVRPEFYPYWAVNLIVSMMGGLNSGE